METSSPSSQLRGLHSQSILPAKAPSDACSTSVCLPTVDCCPTLAINCSNSSAFKTGASSRTGTSAQCQCEKKLRLLATCKVIFSPPDVGRYWMKLGAGNLSKQGVTTRKTNKRSLISRACVKRLEIMGAFWVQISINHHHANDHDQY